MIPLDQFASAPQTSTILENNMWHSGHGDGIADTYGSHGSFDDMGRAYSDVHGTMNQTTYHRNGQDSKLLSGTPIFGNLSSNWELNSSTSASPEVTLSAHQPAMQMDQAIASMHQGQGLGPQTWGNEGSHHPMSASLTAENIIVTERELAPTLMPTALHQAQSASRSTSEHVSPQRSPSPSTQVHCNNPVSPVHLQRRGSTASELANNVDMFHLQRVATHSSSDEEVFKTPKLPNLNLAARRKKERPAALVAMRTVSTPNTGGQSPLLKTNAVSSTAVRRIKSTGNSLNVYGSRISKSGASSAQRSPLAQTFRDASMLEKLSMSSSRLTGSPHGDAASNGQQPNVSPEEASGMQPWANSPSDCAPPLSASFTQHSSEDHSWAISPPITPIYKPNFFHQLRSNSDVPQSAPAHITAFPNLSPPTTTHGSGDHTNSFAGGPYQDTSFYAPVPMPLPLNSHSYLLSSFDHEQHQPRIMRPDSGAAHYGLFSMVPVPQIKEPKELEVVMANFPTPEARPRSLPRQNQGNSVFTFQNTGPKDYASAD
jgi:hypothetical protein